MSDIASVVVDKAPTGELAMALIDARVEVLVAR
jgi:hypothetical protein